MIDGHGDDLFRYGGAVKVNFSTNIPQRVDHSGLLDHLSRQGDIFRNYPEPAPLSVERKLAALHGLDERNVIVTNGATEAIYLLAHAWMGRRSVIIAPTFREYQDACSVFGHTVNFVGSLEELPEGPDMVWLCNPNNPTGHVYDREALLDAVDSHKTTVFVVDQAYAAYSVKEVLTIDDVEARDNMVMLHSLTKQYMVPGLRIGYAVGSGAIMDRLRGLRMPWSVNSVAICAAHYLIDNSWQYRIDAVPLHNEACRLVRALREMGIEAADTDCNFILASLKRGSSAALKTWLVGHHGLLIRDASNFEGLSPRHFRIAAQSRDENNLLINAMEQWNML